MQAGWHTLIPPWFLLFFQSASPPFCEISQKPKYSKMSTSQKETSKTKLKTQSIRVRTLASSSRLTFKKVAFHIFIYSLAQLLSVLRICVGFYQLSTATWWALWELIPRVEWLWAHNNVIWLSSPSPSVFSQICVCDRGLSERPSANLYCIGSLLIPSPWGDRLTHSHTHKAHLQKTPKVWWLTLVAFWRLIQHFL